ncbi:MULTISPECIES: cation-translocating P-type ATPase [unclassified Granulicatella]|uniref:cation-translocating P-type ATPase n=1 Tax=unclassified Granulicatella TaxID=2630493 RepID=UPI00107499EB|nr:MULTISPECIES: cation-translocating P-type ATPase [unclassified Granulicatella]MBF0780112.1 cation-translocating P-type ATPase [Granulicatella sp. 19428wC4_WM01]TFU95778.1 cation-translocating P-type ATPase [Granulicatella sp. WM01]
MSEQNFFSMEEQEVFATLDSSKSGLSSQEAKHRLEKYGENILEEGEKRSLLQKFIDQFKDFMIAILVISAIASVVVSFVEGEPDFHDAIIIMLVVILNAVLGVAQEAKAEEAVNALKKMASPAARVIRDGHTLSLKSEEIVIGDIVLLEAGDVVPADLRLLEANSLKIEEAALTGESVPVEKSLTIPETQEAGIGDRINMAFSSTNVTYGRGMGIVCATGMSTEVGKIASMLVSEKESKTPLQENQDQLGKWLTIAILIIAAIIFGIGLLQGREATVMLLTAISIAVAAIPEGLPAISTIILALGTRTMADKQALVRKLPAVETLGGTEIICSDKTGTLTLNQMTVEKIFYNNELHDSTEDIVSDLTVLRSVILANDTKFDATGNLIGDPTETAFIQFGLDKHINISDMLSQYPRIAEVPFDSDRKLMSTIHQLPDNRYLVAVKGAPDQLLNRCVSYDNNGTIEALNEDTQQLISANNSAMARQALRVLAGAYTFIDALPETISSETIEKDLIFAGLVGMIDPERTEAAEAIAVAKQAGIRTIMITGDHRDTAEAIAKRLGIIEDNQTDAVLTGAQLDGLSDEELRQHVAQYSVYARVSPEHKVRIVKAWQSHNKVVAMTGDGVNDAPSLKAADIGIGMGITGTEVSKGASDMVLADDNFKTIVAAVEEGRKVFSNIQKAVQYLLSANLGEVLTLFIATMAGWSILAPIHILWINLVTDVFPAIALGLEESDKGVMQLKPRGKSSNFLSNGVLESIIYQGILEASLTLGIYWYAEMHYNHLVAQTMAFVTLGLIQLFHAFNVKYVYDSLFTSKPFQNKWFNYAVVVSAMLLLAVVIIPGVNTFFDSASLSGIQWLIVFGVAFSIIPIVELCKIILRLAHKR